MRGWIIHKQYWSKCMYSVSERNDECWNECYDAAELRYDLL